MACVRLNCRLCNLPLPHHTSITPHGLGTSTWFSGDHISHHRGTTLFATTSRGLWRPVNCCRWVNEYELEMAAQSRKEEAIKEIDVRICTMKYHLRLHKMERIKRALYMKHLPIIIIISLCSHGGGPVRSCSSLKPEQSLPFILSSSPPHTRKL